MPSGVKLMPHTHPEDRIYTVISGVFYIGRGEHFDSEKLEAYPPGAVIVLPAVPLISTGRDPASTSPRYRPSAHSALNTWTELMTPATAETARRERSTR